MRSCKGIDWGFQQVGADSNGQLRVEAKCGLEAKE
jgi:hypothetical protein